MKMFRNLLALGVTLLIALSGSALAQEDKDNTGTNPVNFTYDFRLITEMQKFTDDGGSLVKNTVEFRAPLGRNIANLQGKGEDSLFYNMGKKFGVLTGSTPIP